MKIVFDPSFDGESWPGPLGRREACFDEAWLGPLGLLSFLELRAGLSAPDLQPGLRLASVARAARETEGFWSASAEADAFGAARALIEWHDALGMAGWDGEALSPRLASLSRLMEGRPGGLAPRIAAIAAERVAWSRAVEEIALCEPVSSLEAAWRAALAALNAGGVRITRFVLDGTAQRGDLAASRQAGFSPAFDGSLQLLRPRGVASAAEEAAAWLAAAGGASAVVIGADATLDRAMLRFGLPGLGARGGDGLNPYLEVLPLAMALSWAPADPGSVLELLDLQASPIPRGLAMSLGNALSRWPAVGGDAWREALREGLAKLEAEGRGDEAARARAILDSPAAGADLDAAAARERARCLLAWLDSARPRGEMDAARASAAKEQCRLFLGMLEASGLRSLRRGELGRLVEEASRPFRAARSRPAEAGIGQVAEPGAVYGPADLVLWWNFSRESVSPIAAIPLSREEREELTGRGVALPDPGAQALARSARWNRPLHFAQRALCLVCPARDETGEELHPHPLWDEIRSRAASPGRLARLVAPQPAFPGSAPARAADTLPLASPRAEWRVGRGEAPAPGSITPSLGGDLVACPFKWALSYPGSIQKPRWTRLPSHIAALGNLAHAAIQIALGEGGANPEAAETLALECFDRDGPGMVVALFVPGAEREKAKARSAIAASARALAEAMRDRGLRFVDKERSVSFAPARGPKVEGRVDLLLGDPPRVVDLKWGRADDRRAELKAGAEYQLAAYSFVLGGGDPSIPAAYFVIDKRRFLAPAAPRFPGAEAVEGPSLGDSWTAFFAAVEARLAEVGEGRIRATGELDDTGKTKPPKATIEGGALRLPPPCRYCDFKPLCGYGAGSL